ncbi:hypothetical protein Tco_1065731 [Tanacetum coccineum]
MQHQTDHIPYHHQLHAPNARKVIITFYESAWDVKQLQTSYVNRIIIPFLLNRLTSLLKTFKYVRNLEKWKRTLSDDRYAVFNRSEYAVFNRSEYAVLISLNEYVVLDRKLDTPYPMEVDTPYSAFDQNSVAYFRNNKKLYRLVVLLTLMVVVSVTARLTTHEQDGVSLLRLHLTLMRLGSLRGPSSEYTYLGNCDQLFVRIAAAYNTMAATRASPWNRTEASGSGLQLFHSFLPSKLNVSLSPYKSFTWVANSFTVTYLQSLTIRLEEMRIKRRGSG